MCVTSAMKGLGATVKSVLGAVKDGNWSAYSGKVESLGLVSGTDIESNYVQLPVDTWTMKNFSVEDYKRLVSDIFEKKIEISDAIADVPAHSITLNQYPNIK